MINENRLIWEKYTGRWEITPTSEVDLPDGRYRAIQSGYEVSINGKTFTVENGIRGKNFPYNAEIENGKLFFSYT